MPYAQRMSVSMSGQSDTTVTPTNGVLMILQDGPLDGEQQICANLHTDPGSILYFNLPSYQTFEEDGETVATMGLICTYTLVGPGQPPNPSQGDTWESSWIYEFSGEEFVPRPPPVVPIPPPPIQQGFVAMEGDTTMEIDALDPVPGASMVVLEGDTTLDAELQFAPAGGINMVAVTLLITEWDPHHLVVLEGDTSMTVNGFGNMLSLEDYGFEGGTVGDWVVYSGANIVNSLAQAHSGTHSLSIISTVNNTTSANLSTHIPVIPGSNYTFSAWGYCATTARNSQWSIYFYDSGNNLIAPSAIQIVTPTVLGQWTQSSQNITAPSNAAYLVIIALFQNALVGEVFYIDDIVLEFT